jgi:hypothetical protein
MMLSMVNSPHTFNQTFGNRQARWPGWGAGQSATYLTLMTSDFRLPGDVKLVGVRESHSMRYD